MRVEYDAGAEAKVADYLRRVRQRLGADKSVDAEEVANDLRTHIERELSEMRQPVSEADVSRVLDRLGPPEQVVSEEDVSQGAKLKMFSRNRVRRWMLRGGIIGAIVGFLLSSSVVWRNAHQWVTADFVISEADTWTLATPTEIRASSTFSVVKHPVRCEDVVIQFPVGDVMVNAVKCGNEAVPFSKRYGRGWRIDLSSRWHRLSQDTITVDWSFPTSAVVVPKTGNLSLPLSGQLTVVSFKFPLSSLLPSVSFKLMFGLGPESECRFCDRTTSNPTLLFSANGNPKVVYGSCGHPPLEKIPKINDVRPSAPTALPAQHP